MMFQTPSYPEILYLTADIFSYSCPGFSGNTERNFASEDSLGCIFFGWVEMYDDVWLLVGALVHGRSCDTTIVKKV